MLLRNIFIIVSAVILLLVLLYACYRIIRHLNSLKVILIDYALGFVLSTLLFNKAYKILFNYLRNIIESVDRKYFRENESAEMENFISRFISDTELLQVLLLISILFIFSYISSLVRIKYKIGNNKGSDEDLNYKREILLKNIFTSAIIISSIYLAISTLIAVSFYNNYGNSRGENVVKLLKQEFEKYDVEDDSQKNYYLSTIDQTVEGIESDSSLKIPSNFELFIRNSKNNINFLNKKLDEYENLAINSLSEIQSGRKDYEHQLRYKNHILSEYYSYRNYWNYFLKNNFDETISTINDWKKSEAIRNDPYYFDDRTFLNFNTGHLIPTFTNNNSQTNDDSIFNIMAGWLIDSKSYQFILIAGLIGFGFLGAAVSSIVRQSARKEENELLLSDLLGVIIRGFTAALIIFLAVKGGLSILVRDNVELNAYALFFTCFASAVYSENAWAWAKKKLTANLNELEGTNKESENLRKTKLKTQEAFTRISDKLDSQKSTFFFNKKTDLFKIIGHKLNSEHS